MKLVLEHVTAGTVLDFYCAWRVALYCTVHLPECNMHDHYVPS